MQTQRDVYQLSGKLGSGIIAVPIVGILAAIVLSVAYSYINVYSPVVGYITIAVLAGYVFGLAWSIQWAARISKCRNVMFVGIVALLVTLLAEYMQWGVFIYAFFGRADALEGVTLIDVLLQAGATWQAILAVNEDGWFSVFGFEPSGISAWVLWGIEGLLIVGGGTLLAAGMMSGRAFCEVSGTWCEQRKDHLRRGVPEDDSTADRLAAGDLSVLAELPSPAPDADCFLRVDTWSSDAPDGLAAYHIQAVTLTVDEGKLKEDENAVTQMLVMTRQELAYLDGLAVASPEPARADVPPAGEADPQDAAEGRQ